MILNIYKIWLEFTNTKSRRWHDDLQKYFTSLVYHEGRDVSMKIIKGKRDSLGVPMEPDEVIKKPYVVTWDCFGNEIWNEDTDEYILVAGDLVKYEKSDACQYLLDVYDGVIYTVSEIEGGI